MKERFLEKSTIFIRKYNEDYSEEDIEKIQYGLEGIYLTITKLLIIFFLAAILGIIKELIILLVFFNIIRYPAFGVHADKSSVCLISSTILILGMAFLMTKITINIPAKIIISIICFIDYLIFAPADTIKRPLTNKKKRKYRKISSCVLTIVYITLSFTIKNQLISNLVIGGLIIEAILINPLAYKILGMPYNNYKIMN